MKQPLIVNALIPPAQAEALYDIALKSERPERRPEYLEAFWPGEDWDDEVPPSQDRGVSPNAQLRPSSSNSSR